MRMSITRRSEITTARCSTFRPTFRRNQSPDEKTGEQQLDCCRDVTRLVSPAAAMKQLLPARPRQADEMLEIGRARGERTDGGRVAGPAHRSEQRDDEEAASDLEADVVDVLVGHLVAEQVKGHAEKRRSRAGADRGSDRRARGRMERHDHPGFVPDTLKVARPDADLRSVAVDSRLLGYWEAQRALRGGAIEDAPSATRHGEQPAATPSTPLPARRVAGARRAAEALVAFTLDDR